MSPPSVLSAEYTETSAMAPIDAPVAANKAFPTVDPSVVSSNSFMTSSGDSVSVANVNINKSGSVRKPARECDFDKNPTKLYLLIQEKMWDETSKFAAENPLDACTWVSRREKTGKVRWCLLPLHAAIIFKAPERTIEALLCSYPPGAQCKDDQGMLPIHLAFRNGSSEGVVNLLLVAYPQSIEVMDRKGRIPLVLAQASASPNREAFVRALERGPSYYAVAAAATERAAVTAEQRALFERKLIEMKKEHEDDVAALLQSIQTEKVDLNDKIAGLEEELTKTQETSQVLVDHVNSLEAQLSSRGDTERFLATKIATLDSSLRQAEAAREASHKELVEKNQFLEGDNLTLTAQLHTTTDDLKQKASEKIEFSSKLQKQTTNLAEDKDRLERSLKRSEMERATFKANATVLEAQLKKKIETEHSLATQVADLAGKLAESAQHANVNSDASSKKVEKLEEDRARLRLSVENLTEQLQNVALALDAMAAEQERIVATACKHEQTMSDAALAQRQIVDDVTRQEESNAAGAREREQIVAVLTRQAEEVESQRSERDRILDMVGNQEEQMRMAHQEKDALLDSVGRQRTRMMEIQKNTVQVGLKMAEQAALDENEEETVVAFSNFLEEKKDGEQEESSKPLLTEDVGPTSSYTA